MAVYETSHAPKAGVRVPNLFFALVSTVLEWNDRRVTRNALSSLSTRELEDIGLSRGDVADM